MPIENNKLFFLSGVLSFLLFALIVIIVAWQVNNTTALPTFAMVQSDVISVSLEMSEKKVSEPILNDNSEPSVDPIEPPQPKQKEVKKKSTPVQPKINDLFSSVKTTETSPKKESVELSKLNELEQKVLSTKRDSQLFEKAKNVNLAKSGVKMLTPSSGPLVNEYYAKVQGIIYTNFHPASGTEGFSARVRITLNSNGSLSGYRVISYSGNTLFNAEVDWLKERLKQVSLPSHPQGETAVFEIILTAKD